MMNKDIILGIGDYVLTGDCDAKVRVYALGSCIALILYEPVHRYLAMVHIMAPRISPGVIVNQNNCGLYADAAVPWLIDEFRKRTGEKSICYAGIVGGAKGASDLELLAIGDKNLSAVTMNLISHRIYPSFRDVGGRLIRGIEAEVATGIVKVQRRPFQRIGHIDCSENQEYVPISYTHMEYRLGKATKETTEIISG